MVQPGELMSYGKHLREIVAMLPAALVMARVLLAGDWRSCLPARYCSGWSFREGMDGRELG